MMIELPLPSQRLFQAPWLVCSVRAILVEISSSLCSLKSAKSTSCSLVDNTTDRTLWESSTGRRSRSMPTSCSRRLLSIPLPSNSRLRRRAASHPSGPEALAVDLATQGCELVADAPAEPEATKVLREHGTRVLRNRTATALKDFNELQSCRKPMLYFLLRARPVAKVARASSKIEITDGVELRCSAAPSSIRQPRARAASEPKKQVVIQEFQSRCLISAFVPDK